MPSFPLLKTAAIAQYGASRKLRFATKVVRFVDGTEQRFQEYNAALRVWTIRLDLLDESELTQLDRFYAGEAGQGGTFTFTDPWDGIVYPSCSFVKDRVQLEFNGITRGRTTVSVRENRT